MPVTSLPIHTLFAPIRHAFSQVNQVILEAPTGAGKSTALPLEMLDWPELNGKILMLEPRRVAARNVAQFIAHQRGTALGNEVGYRVRGDSKVSANTRLEIVTEGVLTRMIQRDPELSGVALVIFDEIHERHLTTDFGLALALEIQASFREDLMLLAMSATLSGLPLNALMPAAHTLCSEGRSFPVQQSYRAVPIQSRWLDHMATVILEALHTEQQGSLLAFLPGQKEIKRLQHLLAARLDPSVFILCPLYGSLSAKAQDLAIAPPTKGRRKVVLATNVAESSLTIEGITQVVDSGYKRQASFNPKTGGTRLSLKRISQASAAQRSGRAGRLMAGLSIRLWSQEEHDRLIKADEPEVRHTDLIAMVLDAAYWGVKSLDTLPMLTAPSSANESVSWQLLAALEMVDDKRVITAHGRSAYTLGCQPRIAHMLLKAKQMAAQEKDPSLLTLAVILAATLESRSRSRKGCEISHYFQDAVASELNAIGQWLNTLAAPRSSANELSTIALHASADDIATLLAFAYPDRIAKQRGSGSYQLASGSGVQLSCDDALFGQPWLVIADFQESEGRSNGQVYLAAALNESLFSQPLAGLVQSIEHGGWDPSKGRFYAETQRKVGHIILSKVANQHIDKALISDAIVEQIELNGLRLLKFDERTEQLRYRVAIAAKLAPAEDWPSLHDEHLMATLNIWLKPYLDGIRNMTQLQQLDCYTLLLNLMPWARQQQLASLLPTKWPMATGTQAKIEYDAQGNSRLSVRLQEVFGMEHSPRLANGKLIVTLELLSPARRPLALTADLSSFWKGSYEHVKKEMKGRYPKHLWPDDPANTQPTKLTKKKTLNSPSR